MSKFIIEGGKKLSGQVRIHGAKNAVLPILAASILHEGKCIIHDCPKLRDVDSAINILKSLGANVSHVDSTVTVDATAACGYTIAEGLMREMRSSIMFLGPILARFKKAVMSMPGGCELGPRPIDLHLKALRYMGVKISEEHGFICCEADRLIGANIHLDFPSVGATENIMMCACFAEGTSTITNSAKEPEIYDLAQFLNSMGAKIYGAGSSVIRIEGVKKLYDSEYRAIPDRIVTATYLSAAAATGSVIEIENVIAEHIEAIVSLMRDMGCKIYYDNNKLIHIPPKTLRAVDYIRTMPYPGFPTDAGSPVMATLSLAKGTSMFVENIFENRYRHVYELLKMGADITVDGRTAVIRGVKKLSGANVCAMDLRGGAALIVAGLAAEGHTTINSIDHILRGYENIDISLQKLGAKIKRID